MRLILASAALLALTACASLESPQDQVGGNRMIWRCEGGASFTATITSDGRARVVVGGQTYSLPHESAGAGARYANGGIVYWERAGQATLTGARGGPYTNCRR